MEAFSVNRLEQRVVFVFQEKENGKKEMNERKIATFRKDFGESDL